MRSQNRKTPLEARYWPKVAVRGADECWPWIGALNSDGYGLIRDGRRVVLAHRLALRFAGRDPGELCALHSCDNPACQNPAHLSAGTHLKNMAEMVARGRCVPGRKLTREQVAQVRALAGSVSQRELGLQFGIAQQTISKILNGQTYRAA